MHSTEKAILTGIRQGDKKVFGDLFDKYYTRMYLYALSYLDDAAEADDIVQDIFFHLWERRKALDIFSSLEAYLFRSVHNKSIQHLRHRKVVEEYEGKHRLKLREAEILFGSSPDFSFSNLEMNEIRKIFDRTFASLPEKAREIFRLSREENRTNTDIAQSLNINVKTVEYHMGRALKVFRYALRDYIILCLLTLNLALAIFSSCSF